MNTLSQYIYFSSAEEQAQCNQCMQECCQLETAALCEKMSVKSLIAISAFGHRIVPQCSYNSMFYNLVTIYKFIAIHSICTSRATFSSGSLWVLNFLQLVEIKFFQVMTRLSLKEIGRRGLGETGSQSS